VLSVNIYMFNVDNTKNTENLTRFDVELE